MKHYGIIAHWNEARKFGAILEEYSQKEVFAPLSSFEQTAPLPTVGERVSFDMTKGRRNRNEAVNIRYMDRVTDEGIQNSANLPAGSLKKTAVRTFTAALIAFGGYYAYHTLQNGNLFTAKKEDEIIVQKVADQINADRQAWKEALAHPSQRQTSAPPQAQQETTNKTTEDNSLGSRIMKLFDGSSEKK